MVQEDDLMRVVEWFQEKWMNNVRLYGLGPTFVKIIMYVICPIYRNYCCFFLAIRDPQPDLFTDYPEIRAMTAERIEFFLRQGGVSKRHERKLKRFLAQGCQGFMAEIDGRFAGYAFIQPAGECTFDYNGRFQIAPGIVLMRYLFVFSEFRGQSLGKKFNQALIAAISSDKTPIVFVKTENRFSIRNLKMFGFEEMLRVTRTTWLGKWSAQRIEVLFDSEISRRIISGLTPADRGEKAGA
jgi:GNAT superfamily N-acetyltransferase